MGLRRRRGDGPKYRFGEHMEAFLGHSRHREAVVKRNQTESEIWFLLFRSFFKKIVPRRLLSFNVGNLFFASLQSGPTVLKLNWP